MIWATEEVVTITLKAISATIKMILATDEVLITTLKVISATTKVILDTEEVISVTVKESYLSHYKIDLDHVSP